MQDRNAERLAGRSLLIGNASHFPLESRSTPGDQAKPRVQPVGTPQWLHNVAVGDPLPALFVPLTGVFVWADKMSSLRSPCVGSASKAALKPSRLGATSWARAGLERRS